MQSDEGTTVQHLFLARRDGLTGIELNELGYSRDHALALQLAVLDRFLQAGDNLSGWKVAFTSGRSHDRMGPGYRPFGYILSSRTFASDARVPFRSLANVQIEPELCLVLGALLRGNVSRDQARAAVISVAPAFEVNEVRFAAGADDATILADGVGNWGLVVGEQAPAPLKFVPMSVKLWGEGEFVDASRPDLVMDDPYQSLARLSHMLDSHGRWLRAGDCVITGSFLGQKIDGPSVWRASFSGLGEVQVQFTAS